MARKVSEASQPGSPHKSFRRSYREDYVRELNVPGIMQHIFTTFKMIFENWRLFLPLLGLAVVLAIVLVGLMSQATYEQFGIMLDQIANESGEELGGFAKSGLLLLSTITTGGLAMEAGESVAVFGVLIFLMLWLTTIFILRHKMAKHELKLRDALYNAMTPLLSTLAVFVVAVIQCIPIFILIIAYSAAVQTDFLATPFYALMFLVFAGLMILLSSYLLSSSIIALVAVSAPGLYPMVALRTASELMVGRRIRFVIRLIALIVVLIIMWVVVMIPLIWFDLGMKNFDWAVNIPFIPFCLVAMTCFTGIYSTVYLYIYYRWLLDN
ncbi:hypothetical protein IJG04_01350 [Candidatus Saccharibacteria bacterium]|nr:hypothetical protein [Candidatus Saccharibacteria bacterium]